MPGHVIHVKAQKHRCEPPTEDVSRTVTIQPPRGLRIEGSQPLTFHPQHEVGTIWECDCGRWWRAYRPYVNVMTIEWRRAVWAKHWHAWRTVWGL